MGAGNSSLKVLLICSHIRYIMCQMSADHREHVTISVSLHALKSYQPVGSLFNWRLGSLTIAIRNIHSEFLEA